jgi:hypothetical protein
MPADPLAPLVNGSDRADNFPDSGGVNVSAFRSSVVLTPVLTLLLPPCPPVGTLEGCALLPIGTFDSTA